MWTGKAIVEDIKISENLTEMLLKREKAAQIFFWKVKTGKKAKKSKD